MFILTVKVLLAKIAMVRYRLIRVGRYDSISDSNALVNIINLDNRLYSMFMSRLLRRQYLLLTAELTTTVSIGNMHDYTAQFSDSYTDLLHIEIHNTTEHKTIKHILMSVIILFEADYELNPGVQCAMRKNVIENLPEYQ